MTEYWLIKLLLLAGLGVLTWLVLRPVRSQSHLALRRLTILALLIFAIVAIVFPTVLNRLAVALGVERGVNLLVYALAIALFAHMTTVYRREAAQERRLTALARAIALTTVKAPEEARSHPPTCENPPETTGNSSVRHSTTRAEASKPGSPGATIASDEHTRHE